METEDVKTEAAEQALSPSEFRDFKLVYKERISPNSSLYRFAFPDPSAISGLHVASCLMTQVRGCRL
jgi:hypothetical protein